MILLVSATELEIPSVILNKPAGVKLLITGVGIPAALYHLQNEISASDYSLVIQAGIAGAYTSEFSLGETVMVKQDCFADLGAEENNIFSSIFDMGFTDKNEFPFSDGWLKNEHFYTKQSSLELVKAATVMKVTGNQQQVNLIKEKYNPEIESMEGAALHYVCLMEKIPFLQIRSISNYVGDRNKTNWKIEDAVKNLNTELQKLITELQ